MTFHDELVGSLRFVGGHADVLGLVAQPGFLVRAAEALADPFCCAGVTKVAAVEARGFVLGTAVAVRLGCGFVPIRKGDPVNPGPKAERRTPPDWRGRESVLRVQRAVLRASDHVLLVDDWAETGSQALTARALIEECGARYAGLSLLVDQLSAERRRELAPVAAVARHDELASSGSHSN